MIAPSYFQNLANSQNLQFLLDNSQQNLEMQSFWRTMLRTGIPQMSLSFDAAIGRERIAAAASIVDSDAPAPLRSRKKLELYKGKIPAIKEKFRMNQDDMRNLEVLKSLPINGGGSTEALIQFLNSDLQEAAVSGDKRIDFMLMQQISTLTVDVSATNNPDGIILGTIDLLAKSYQKQGVPVVWTDLANADPVTDILTYTQWVWKTKGRNFGKIMMSYDLWITFMNCAKVKSMLATFFNVGKQSATFAVTLENVNALLTANKLPNIEIVQHITHIEIDGKPTFVNPFNTNNVSFVPAGNLGVLHNAISMEEIHPVSDKSYAKFGPTLVSKWSESDPLVEFTGMEMNAFPMVDVDNIFILTTDVVKAAFNDN
jgi:hypothetical protein